MKTKLKMVFLSSATAMAMANLRQRISRSCGNYLKGKGRSWPWLMLPPAVDESGNIVFKYRRCGIGNKEDEVEEELIHRNSGRIPAESELVGSSHGWVALQSYRHLFLSNPINNQHIKLPDPLPSLGPANRLILSSSASASEPLALAFLITCNPRSRIAFCSPLRSKEWTLLGDDYSYKNLAYSTKHKLLFCIRRQGHSTSLSLEGWDVAGRRAWVLQDDEALNFGDRHFWWPVMTGLKRQCTKMYYLVCASDGDLFLVVRHVNLRVGPYGGLSLVEKVILCPDRGCLVTRSPYKTIDFDVYKIDVEGGGGVTHMSNSLQGLAMFVGLGHPFAIPAAELAGLMPDSVYFTDERCLAVQAASGYGGHDNGIFDYKGKDFYPCCNFYPIDHRNVTTALPLPLWFTPSPSSFSHLH